MRKSKALLVLSSIALLVLAACGTTNKNDSNKEEKEATILNLSEFDDEVAVHTELQRKFFEIDTEDGLANLTTAGMKAIADGSKNLSSPLSINLSWEHEQLENFDHYEVEFTAEGDFSEELSTTYVGTKEKSIEIINLCPNTEYSYRVLGYYSSDSELANDPEISETKTLYTEDGPIRNLVIDGITNVRDLGGKELASGGTFKYGQLYRTAGFYNWDNKRGAITEKGIEQVKQFMPFKTEIELRGGANGGGGEAGKEDASMIPDVDFKFVPWAYEGGRNLIYRNIEPLKKAFDVLGEPSNYPIDFHCRIGTDRTGAVALLVNGLVGVSVKDIYRDYLFSNFGQINTSSDPRIIGDANKDSCRQYVEHIRQFPGEHFHNKVYNFLSSIGIPTQKLDNIIDTLTFGDKVTNDSKTTIYSVKDAETTLTKTDSTATRQPACAAKFNANGNKVTFKVNAEKDGKANLYLGIMSRSTNGKLSNTLKVKVDGTELALAKDRNYETNDLGFASSNDFWEYPLINEVNLTKGQHTVEVERTGSEVFSISSLNVTTY